MSEEDSVSSLVKTALALSVALGAGCLLGSQLYGRCREDEKKRDSMDVNALEQALSDAQTALEEKEKEIARQLVLRQDERQGRIHAEQALRQQRQQRCEQNGFNFNAIGHIESPFVDRRGTAHCTAL